MELTAGAIAEFLGGVVEGDSAVTVTEFARIEEGFSGAVSFLSNPKYEHFLYTTESSIVLVNRDYELTGPVKATLVRVDDAYGALGRLLALAASQAPRKRGIHPLACIEESATVSASAYVGAFAYVGEEAVVDEDAQIYPNCYVGDRAHIGHGTILYAGVRVYQDCEVGANSIVHAGAVIGADGFGFASQPDGSYVKIPQLGNVVVGDAVEIGANTTIDRAAMGSTRIGDGVKLDNLVQIAHNVEVGDNTAIAAQSGVAGSTKIGQRCVFAGQVGVVGHIQIADDVKVGAQAGVSNSVRSSKEALMGSPAMPIRAFYRSSAYFRRLSDMAADIERLKRGAEGSEES